jgi:hypothetical protein
MKRRYRILTGKATSKSVAEQAAGLAALQSWAKHSLEELSATMGLMMLDLMLTAEIQERTGKRGRIESRIFRTLVWVVEGVNCFFCCFLPPRGKEKVC